MILTSMDLAEFDQFVELLRLFPEQALDCAGEAAIEAAKYAHQITMRTTTHWSTRPVIETEVDIEWGDMAVLLFEVKSRVWHWLDEGTKPHVIRARLAPFLKFRLGYIARTTPGKLTSSAHGGTATGPWVQTQSVNHPGTVARGWTPRIAQLTDERWNFRFAKLLLERWQERPVPRSQAERKYPHKERT